MDLIIRFIQWFVQKFGKQKFQPVQCIKTFGSGKEARQFIKSLKSTARKATILERGCYGGGCPAPDQIVGPSGLFDDF